MTQTAKLFTNGRSQAVRLPLEFRFQGVDEVFIRKDPATGAVILSAKPNDWEGFFKAVEKANIPADFLSAEERQSAITMDDRDPFSGSQFETK